MEKATNEDFHNFDTSKFLAGYKINEYEMRGTCSLHEGNEEPIQDFVQRDRRDRKSIFCCSMRKLHESRTLN
jgi:hypothetical protein